ncbi:MAG: undecaprenyl-diphosphate phosphatase [Coriobacteriia bacterium]|nr:undecaprenyl-diphosphate phosphatase [Coriobacteriia bacterium]
MPDVARALVLGVVQGLAEFLPISSSGHLAVLQEGLGWSGFGLFFDVTVHLATLLAVVVYFRSDLALMARAFARPDASLAGERRFALLVLAATVPTAVIGLLGDDLFEHFFSSLVWVGAFFLVTTVALVSSEMLSRKTGHDAHEMAWGKALLIGAAQGMAIAPGISRSGATIAAGLGVGLDREQAARFSFLLSGPIILLAGVKTGLDAVTERSPVGDPLAVAAGFVAAAVTGYLAIAGMLAFVKRRPLYAFAAYTGVLGVSVLVWQLT